jgi:hypothetical protein
MTRWKAGGMVLGPRVGRRKAGLIVLGAAVGLAGLPVVGVGQTAPGPSAVIQITARERAGLAEGLRERIRRVPNVGRIEPFLEGRTGDGVRVIGVEPAPTVQLRAGKELLPAAIVQGRGLEAGDSPEALVVGKTFSQKHKTALGLSIPAMLTKDHFPPLVVGGQGFAIVGIYATGDAATDDQVLMLLPTAQRLLKQPGRWSGAFVIPASPAAAEPVVRDLGRALGAAAEVTTLPRRAR